MLNLNAYFSSLGANPTADDNIEKGEFDYMFASPEMLVGDKDWRGKIQKFEVSTIVVDQFHTISTWYVCTDCACIWNV